MDATEELITNLEGTGYRGADCGQCALGWKPLNNNDDSGSCVKVASAEQFASMGLTTTMRVAPPPRSESGSSSFQAGFATAAVMGSAIMTCLLACYCFRNRSNHLHHHMRLNSDSPSPYQNPGGSFLITLVNKNRNIGVTSIMYNMEFLEPFELCM
jgi:hypothetical protein